MSKKATDQALSPQVIMGIDPGTAATGIGFIRVSEGQPELVEFNCIHTGPESGPEERLLVIHAAVREALARRRPRIAVVERLFFSRNVRTAMAVGEARGVILLACAQEGVPVTEYTPLQVKEAVVGYGRASKRQVKDAVQWRLGMERPPTPADAADALAIALCHLYLEALEEKSSQ